MVNKQKKNVTLPLSDCLAKTRKKNMQVLAGRNVEEHCRIAGEIAKKLLEGYFAKIVDLFPENAHLLALVHDIGKVSPTFQKKIRRELKVFPPELDGVEPELERQWGGHAGVGYASVFEFTDDEQIARIVGFHHGRNFSDANEADDSKFGGPGWEKLRHELLKKLLENNSLPELDSHIQEMLVLGLVVLADWIASGSSFDDPEEDWRPLVDVAIERAGLVAPILHNGLRFNQIFSFGNIASKNESAASFVSSEPNAIQRACMECIKEPGVYVIEAPMGMGKTEAALIAAYHLLDSGKANGIYFGLPTQLTSNKIYERVNDFLEKILADSSSAILVHGNSRLKKFLDQELGKEGSPGGSWFDGNRRGLLAPFAVGTLDQALLSVLHVRHAALRALGLAGKVVILDEVHSYDAYTGELLDELVMRLRQCGCTVIILSATLTVERRQKMLGKHGEFSTAYPLLTCVAGNSDPEFVALDPPEENRIKIHFESSDNAAIEEVLLRAEKGQQVLWIENTVARAQGFYRRLGARCQDMQVECGLLHSRFTQRDREANEEKWIKIYGKTSCERGRLGRILVGTQVLEQSLDIDADFLVTRLCPTDMLFQRMGRLWRHKRIDRPESASPATVWILTPPLGEVLAEPKNALKESGTSFIYSPYVLGRTLETWHNRSKVSLPGDIRAILEETYRKRDEEPSEKMQEEKKILDEKRAKHQRQAEAGKSIAGKMLNDDEPGTRLGNEDELKLLLLQDLDLKNGICTFADGAKCELTELVVTADKNKVASLLSLNCLRIPRKNAPETIKEDYLKKFAPFIYEARTWRKEGKILGGNLRIAILDKGQILRDIFGSQIDGIRYSAEIGYRIEE